MERELKNEKITDEVLTMRYSGHTAREINEKYHLEENEISSIQSKIRHRSKNIALMGYMSFFVGIIYLTLALMAGRLSGLAVALVVAGFIKIMYSLRKKAKKQIN